MPLPLFTVAIPILHSSGGWIAATGASGYVAGTLSGTWLGSFVLGNAALLSSLGLISGAGVAGAAGALTGLASATTISIGAGLTAVGLGGVATYMGIAPVTTFLGLTPMGWGIGASAVLLASSIGYFLTKKVMRDINKERAKGGEKPITLPQIIRNVRLLEKESLTAILEKLAENMPNIQMNSDKSTIKIDNNSYSFNRLRYVFNKDGSEEIVFVTRTGKKKSVLIVKKADGTPPIIHT